MAKLVAFPDRALKRFVVHLIGTAPLKVHGRFLRETEDAISIWKDEDSENPECLVLKDAVAAVHCLGDVPTPVVRRKAKAAC